MTADHPGRFPAASAHARRATLALLLASVGCVTALHVLRRDLNPVARRLSEYAIGPYKPLMTLTFVTAGLGLILLAQQLRPSATRAHVVAPLVGLAGAGLLLSGGFPTGSGSAVIELIHSRASATAVVALTSAAVVAAATERGRTRATTRLVTVVAVVNVLLSPLLHDTRWSGLGQRLVWISLGVWLLLMARQLPAGPTSTAVETVHEAPRRAG